MNNSAFIQHYAAQLKTFTKYFSKTQEDFEMEDLHQLRVSIKKMKATWSFVEVISAGNWDKSILLDDVKPMFKAAGKLRETQINLELIEKLQFTGAPAYTKRLHRDESKYLNKFRENLLLFDPVKFESDQETLLQIMETLTDEQVQHKAAVFILEQLRYAESSRKNQLHKTRIAMKMVQEVLAMMKEIHASLDSFRQEIKSLNEHLGKWHDYVVFIASIEDFYKKGGEQAEAEAIKELVDHLEEQQKKRKQEIHAILDQYITATQLEQIEQLC